MTTSQNTPLIAVCAATGNQGKSVALHLLSVPHPSEPTKAAYRVRATVRSLTSAGAVELAEKGAELALATLDDAASLETAFQGADAVFAYTTSSSWHNPSVMTTEFSLGKNVVDACKAATVGWLMFSTGRCDFQLSTACADAVPSTSRNISARRNVPDGTNYLLQLDIGRSMPNATKMSGGKYPIPQYDEKAAIEEYAQSQGVKSTFVYMGGFLSNMINYHYLHATKSEDDPKKVTALTISAPIFSAHVPQPWTSIDHDLGQVVEVVLRDALGWKGDGTKNGQKWLYKHVNSCFAWLSWNEMVEALSKALSIPVNHVILSEADLIKFGGAAMASHIPVFHLSNEFQIFPEDTSPEALAKGCPIEETKGQAFPEADLVEEGVKFDTVEAYTERVLKPWLRQQVQ